jgi:hypothetical protein
VSEDAGVLSERVWIWGSTTVGSVMSSFAGSEAVCMVSRRRARTVSMSSADGNLVLNWGWRGGEDTGMVCEKALRGVMPPI